MYRPQFAILLDGGFLTKNLQQRLGRPCQADDIIHECDRLSNLPMLSGYELLRIYYYDAYPSTESVPRPATRTKYELGNTERFRQAQSLYDSLILKPQIALRMGEVVLSPTKWRLKPRVAKELLKTPRQVTDDDFVLDISQKGVDMRVGMDMARLALREMVRTIVVVTGDSDFVPAFKFVRREGVKIVLDPMGHNVRVELKQHSDFVIDHHDPST